MFSLSLKPNPHHPRKPGAMYTPCRGPSSEERRPLSASNHGLSLRVDPEALVKSSDNYSHETLTVTPVDILGYNHPAKPSPNF